MSSRPHYPLPAFALLLACLPVPAVFGQQTDTVVVSLPALEIEATRATETAATAPYAVSVLRRPQAVVTLEPVLSLDAVLSEVPGLWVNDRGHGALGERLSVRGMGSRAAFGVRGIQVLLDGLPLTMPDGQAVLDIVDPALIRRAELVRGPASRFWGNGSGGVLFLSTTPLLPERALRIQTLGGSHDLRRLSAEATLPAGTHRFHIFASDVRTDGYRDHSRNRFTRAGLQGDVDLSPGSRLRLTAALADQASEHPGALTAAERAADPHGADARFVDTRSGKDSRQVQAGATLLRETNAGLLTATAYGLSRRLDNPLPFAYIDLDRHAGGLRLMLHHTHGPVPWGFGFDGGLQSDDRRNFDNVLGRPGAERNLDQQETVRTVAAFGFARLRLRPRLDLTLSLRADRIRFSMDDRLPDNGDQSGHRAFSALSPAAGLAYRLPSALLFVNYGTAFETPTTTELVNRPDLNGGFNPGLDPQRIRGLEAGIRGTIDGAGLRYDVAVFHLDVGDRLVPFQTEAGGARTFFRNDGNDTHDGVELSASWRPRPGLELQGTYTGSRLVFDDGALAGRRLPGVPDHHAFGSLRVERHGFRARLTAEAFSAYFADDANTVKTDGTLILDLYLGHDGPTLHTVRLQPFFQVNNVFDRSYDGSVSINARGGRFFEPAAGRTVRAGMTVAL